EKQYDEVTDKKGYDALKHEIAAGQEQCRKLEDEILNNMTEIEERTARLPEQAKAVETAKAEYAQWEQVAKARNADQAEQMKQTQAQIQEAEAGVPAEVKV